MEIDLGKVLSDHPELTLFVIIGFGCLIGRLGAFGLRLGSSIGVLFVALFFGHHGYELNPIIGTVGFIFFIYSVGFQAGPRFFQTFRQDGWRYIQIALVIAVTAVGLALTASLVFSFEPGYAAGVLAGALTSTPTLAAAQDAVQSGLFEVPDGLTAGDVISNIAVGYAVSYVFGLIGLLVVIQTLPRLLHIDLVEEAKRLEVQMELHSVDADDELGLGQKGMPNWRVYEVTREEAVGRSLRELRFLETTGAVVSQVRRGDEPVDIGPDTVFKAGDHVMVLGYRESQLKAGRLVGKEVLDADLEQTPFDTRQILISDPEAADRSLREIGVTHRFACIVHRVSRGGIDLPQSMDLRLQLGDYLVVSGPMANLDDLTRSLGRSPTPVHETDLITFALGISLGLLIGFSSIKIGKLPVGIGAAGGLLLAGLIVGWARVRNPIFGRVPRPARFILMELGILLFLAGIGVRAGADLIAGVREAGLSIFISGVFITCVPLTAGIAYGRYVLKLNPALLFGAVSGGLTSTAALNVVTRQARSNSPAIGYAAVYAFANIVLTVSGQLIMLI